VSREGEDARPVAAPEPDLTQCAREPIHIPGAIQPHGALLAMTSDTQVVSHVSENLAAILGRPAELVVGQPMVDILGEAMLSALTGAGSPDPNMLGLSVLLPGPNDDTLHLQAHQSGRFIIVDIEPALPAAGETRPSPWQSRSWKPSRMQPLGLSFANWQFAG
jgi:light-regulated signal transduction histidine kinase (bacteriophytochrome)